MTFEVSKDDVSLFYRNKESNGNYLITANLSDNYCLVSWCNYLIQFKFVFSSFVSLLR